MTPSRRHARLSEAGLTLILLPWGDAGAALGSLRSSTGESIPVVDAGTSGAGAALNEAARERPGDDLIVIADDVTLPDGWPARLLAAACADDAVAFATAYLIGPGDPRLGRPEVPDAPPIGDAQPLHPRVLWPWAHCAWIGRPQFDLLGGFDERFTHPAAALADLGARATGHGFTCAVADDLRLARGTGRLGGCPEPELRGLVERHPWLPAAAAAQVALDPGPLRRSLRRSGTTGSRISLTVDARVLGQGVAGTQTYTRALIRALAGSPELTVRALVPSDAPTAVTEALTADGVQVVTDRDVAAGARRTDVIHRPQQVFSAGDMRVLQAAGDRVLISQMDLILYRTPTYHATAEDWLQYRQAVRMSLAIADRTVFFSEHSRGDALAEELVEADRSDVAGIGIFVEPPGAAGPGPVRPQALALAPDRDFLLVLGADYAHKNRPFALMLADELRTRHGWDGLVVLAGPHQRHGSSAAAERELLAARPELAGRVLDLGPVSEDEKRWLMGHARAQICASDYEGFGLIPLESAAAGRPCIYAPVTSLGEIIDPAAATIVPWDVVASAGAAAGLLHDGDARDRHLSLLRDAMARYTWDAVVTRLVQSYRQAIDSPYRGAAPLAWEAIREEAERRDLQERVAYGQLLIDRQGGLLTRSQQRGLMRVATRPWLRASLLAPFGLLGSDERSRDSTGQD